MRAYDAGAFGPEPMLPPCTTMLAQVQIARFVTLRVTPMAIATPELTINTHFHTTIRSWH